jgi:Zn-dependent protease
VLVHELGHVNAAQHYGCAVSHILLWPLGGLAVFANLPRTPGARMVVAAAGPAMHVPMLLVWIGLFSATGCTYGAGTIYHAPSASGATLWFALFFASLAELNVLMLLFNLCLPIVPLDGAHILVNALLMRGCSQLDAARWALRFAVAGVALLSALLVVELVGLAWVHLSWLTLFTLSFVAWRTHGLYSAYRQGAEAVAAHPLFASPASAGGSESLISGGMLSPGSDTFSREGGASCPTQEQYAAAVSSTSSAAPRPAPAPAPPKSFFRVKVAGGGVRAVDATPALGAAAENPYAEPAWQPPPSQVCIATLVALTAALHERQLLEVAAA